MVIEMKIKKWGNSMGIILPKELIAERNLKEGDSVAIELFHIVNAKMFLRNGPALKRKVTGQQFKDMAREGGDDA